MVALGGSVLVLVGGALLLIAFGLRAGDREGDLQVVGVSPHAEARGVSVALTNPGRAPVIVGLSLRRPGLRLRLEAGAYVSRSRAAAEPLPTVVGVLAPGETGDLGVAGLADLGDRAELLVVVGQEGRLRTIHREVRLRVARPPRIGSVAVRPIRAGHSAE